MPLVKQNTKIAHNLWQHAFGIIVTEFIEFHQICWIVQTWMFLDQKQIVLLVKQKPTFKGKGSKRLIVQKFWG